MSLLVATYACRTLYPVIIFNDDVAFRYVWSDRDWIS